MKLSYYLKRTRNFTKIVEERFQNYKIKSNKSDFELAIEEILPIIIKSDYAGDWDSEVLLLLAPPVIKYKLLGFFKPLQRDLFIEQVKSSKYLYNSVNKYLSKIFFCEENKYEAFLYAINYLIELIDKPRVWELIKSVVVNCIEPNKIHLIDKIVKQYRIRKIKPNLLERDGKVPIELTALISNPICPGYCISSLYRTIGLSKILRKN